MSYPRENAAALETTAGRYEAVQEWDIAVQLRILAAKQWGLAAGDQDADPAACSRYLEHAERNYRALAANADRLADALSALRGRAG